MMLEMIPIKDIADQCKLAKIRQRTIFGAISLLGAIAIALVYDHETLIPIIGILGATAGAVVGIKIKGVTN